MSESPTFKIIAVDGGAATGKSSTSRGLAEKLNYMHVDTGAHYRTLTHALLQQGANPTELHFLISQLDKLTLGTQKDGRITRLSINSYVPAEEEIRSPKVNANVSKFAAIEEVRKKLFDYQRSLATVARSHSYAGLVMEGRDIGSVIFPDADHRFFLHADEATRAARRENEGQTDSITERDKMDKTRKAAPLVCPEGATEIDTAPLTLEEVIETIAEIIQAS
ncbi:MAG: (d)CMP kinase [Lentimonas sp.]